MSLNNILEEDQFENPSALGITIAKQRKKKGFSDEKIVHKTRKRNSTKSTICQEPRRSQSFQVFLETAAIYVACLILPTLIGYIYNLSENWKAGGKGFPKESLWESYFASNSSFPWFFTAIYQPAAEYLCQPDGDGSYTWSIVYASVTYAGLCPKVEDDVFGRNRSVLSDDVSAWNDVFTVAICSFLLATIRITIVQFTVPIEDSGDLEAMVRSKSVHLLSSNYIMTPAGTPVPPKRPLTSLSSTAYEALPFPPLDSLAQRDDDNDMFGFTIDETEVEDDKDTLEEIKSVGNQPQNEAAEFNAALMQGLSSADQSPSKVAARSVYKAPRYATALFRLMFSTVAAIIALVYFRDANFWPWYVFGHGSTEKCWDLSGGLTVGMDSDFDQRNAALKRYFLLQASYHWHSGAFHILSILLLILHPTKHAPRRFLSIQTNSAAYLRSLGQHTLAICLFAASYIFSSLRRLVAIGVFAFDSSSWFLHLLQVCINAPEDSRWKRDTFIRRVYWLLVIPSYLVSRFFIWGSLWYSAAFESGTWLLQLERTLWPGSALQFRSIIHILMVILQVFTVIYFRRLLNHPHLKCVVR